MTWWNIKNCTTLAATLSANYATPLTRYDPSQDGPLSSYLDKNGVLVSMCMSGDHTCTINTAMTNHLSASWIHQSLEGNEDDGNNNNNDNILRVIFPRQFPVGLVVDPTHEPSQEETTHPGNRHSDKDNNNFIRCLYPTDAGTDSRDDSGCGPLSSDPKVGSQGYCKMNRIARYLNRRGLDSYKNINFGHSTNYSDIPCDYFFPLPLESTLITTWKELDASQEESGGGFQDYCDAKQSPHLRRTTWRTTNNDPQKASFMHNITYGNLQTVSYSTYFPYLQDSPCNLGNQNHYFDRDHWWLYVGARSWSPSDFQSMIDAMHTIFLQKGGKTMKLWNEIVLNLPSSPTSSKNSVWGDRALAVFYIIHRDMTANEQLYIKQRAHGQAAILSLGTNTSPNKKKTIHVLEINLAKYESNRQSPLFVCASGEPAETANYNYGDGGGTGSSSTTILPRDKQVLSSSSLLQQINHSFQQG